MARNTVARSTVSPQTKAGLRPLAARPLVACAALALVAFPAPTQAQNQPNGQSVYSSAGCSGCHGPSGGGGIGPKLAGNQKLSDASLVITQILNGGGAMPAFRNQLSQAEIAAVASHVRTSFGNSFGKVSEQQVAQVASGGADGQNTSAAGQSQSPDNAPGAQQNDVPSGAGDEPAGGEGVLAVGAVNLEARDASTSGPSQNDLMTAETATDSWLMYNKGYNNQRWSSLDQINVNNVSGLAPTCIAQLGTTMSFESSPVVYDGLLYITTPYKTFAMDAATCRMKWQHAYSPTGPEPYTTNRGVAIAAGRVFRGTSDGHLLALDAKTGQLLWDARPVDSAKGYFLSSAPIVWKDEVITGTAGADWGANAQLMAFDVATGETRWTFDEVVKDTFGGADPASTGGGSNWTHYAIDPSRGLLYAPVGNPAPDFAPEYRPGKNLYTNSVIAVNLETGKLDHYYQQIPNDALDRDTAAAPVLIQGANGIPYVVATNKAGHLFLYDDRAEQLVWTAETTTISNAETNGRQTRPTREGVHVCPGINGGVEWYGQAYDPMTNRIFTPAVDWCSTFTLGEVRYTPGEFFFGGSFELDPVDEAAGWLRAFDAQNGEQLWQYKSELPMVGGVTPTAGGLVFAGELTGDLIALDQSNGQVLYRFNTGGPIGGGISTYAVDGRQYVAVASGNTSRTWTPDASAASTVVIFALPQRSAPGQPTLDTADQVPAERRPALAQGESSGEQGAPSQPTAQ